MKTQLLSIVLLLLTLVGCSTNPTEPAPQAETKQLLSTQEQGDYTVELYSTGTISVGYTPLYVRVRHRGAILSDAHVTITPDMDMGMHHHSCPTEQPKTVLPDKDGYYACAAVFTMPSSTAWTITVSVHDHDAETNISVVTQVPVAPAETVRMWKSGEERFYLTLVGTTSRVGLNDIRFLLHRTTDGYAYTPVSDATLTFAPSMPSMGHGSEGNIQPSSKDNGWYAGKVNYTMTGDWQIDANATLVDGSAKTVSFPVLVK